MSTLRTRVLSDLHFEFLADGGKSFVSSLDPSGVDLLILAGDITNTRVGFYEALSMFREHFSCPIVYVHGNHEYYDSNREAVANATLEATSRLRDVHWLDCGILTVGGHRILGATLWYRRSRPPEGSLSTSDEWHRGIIRSIHPNTCGLVDYQFPDFACIQNLDAWVYSENERAVVFLADNLREGDIVVTHHLPSKRCVAPQYARSPMNAFFVCDLSQLIVDRKPAAWFFGHTHTSIDVHIGPTRLLCNPLGYVTAGEVNFGFDQDLTVGIETEKEGLAS